MGDAIKNKFGITARLKEGHHGIYEVSLNGKVVYTNQSECGKFPEHEAIFEKIQKYKDPLLTSADQSGMKEYTLTSCGCMNNAPVKSAPEDKSDCCTLSRKAEAENNNSTCCSPQLIPLSSIAPRAQKRHVDIEFMYLDLSSCDRCQGTDHSLDEAISEVARVLEAADIELVVHKIHVQSEEQALKLRFMSSPTIRVNGRDIQLDVKESPCESCGDLCGEDVDCRVWIYQGKEYTSPPKGMIINAILKEVYGGTKEGSEVLPSSGDIPENLKRFFSAKNRKDMEKSRAE